VPYTVLASLIGSPLWAAALALDLLVLVIVAVRRWSPLVVLGTALLSLVGYALAWAIAGSGDGGSSLAAALELAGSLVLALPIGAWGVRRGAAALAAIPIGWVAAGIWIAIVERIT
jgi:hypothetical protein